MIPRVLAIAGSDPSGGAGIQADIKSISAGGGYAMAAVTALTAQNTRGVRAVHVPPPQFLADQLDALSDDIEIDAVKIGMLANSATIEVVTAWLARTPVPYVVLDPVMVATSGDRLLEGDTADALAGLIAQVDLITPNIPELGVLSGAEPARSRDEARARRSSWPPGMTWRCWPRAGTCPGTAPPMCWCGPPEMRRRCPRPGSTPTTPTAPGAHCPRRSRPGWSGTRAIGSPPWEAPSAG